MIITYNEKTRITSYDCRTTHKLAGFFSLAPTVKSLGKVYSYDDLKTDLVNNAYNSIIGYIVVRRLDDDTSYIQNGNYGNGGQILVGKDYCAILYTKSGTFTLCISDDAVFNPTLLTRCFPTSTPFTMGSILTGVCPTAVVRFGDLVVEEYPDGVRPIALPEFSYATFQNGRMLSAFGISTGTWNMDVVPENKQAMVKSLLNPARQNVRNVQYPDDEGIWMRDASVGDAVFTRLAEGKSLSDVEQDISLYKLPPSDLESVLGQIWCGVTPTDDLSDKYKDRITGVLFSDVVKFVRACETLFVNGEFSAQLIKDSDLILIDDIVLNNILDQYQQKYKQLIANRDAMFYEALQLSCDMATSALDEFKKGNLQFAPVEFKTGLNKTLYISGEIRLKGPNFSVNISDGLYNSFAKVMNSGRGFIRPISLLAKKDADVIHKIVDEKIDEVNKSILNDDILLGLSTTELTRYLQGRKVTIDDKVANFLLDLKRDLDHVSPELFKNTRITGNHNHWKVDHRCHSHSGGSVGSYTLSTSKGTLNSLDIAELINTGFVLSSKNQTVDALFDGDVEMSAQRQAKYYKDFEYLKSFYTNQYTPDGDKELSKQETAEIEKAVKDSLSKRMAELYPNVARRKTVKNIPILEHKNRQKELSLNTFIQSAEVTYVDAKPTLKLVLQTYFIGACLRDRLWLPDMVLLNKQIIKGCINNSTKLRAKNFEIGYMGFGRYFLPDGDVLDEFNREQQIADLRSDYALHSYTYKRLYAPYTRFNGKREHYYTAIPPLLFSVNLALEDDLVIDISRRDLDSEYVEAVVGRFQSGIQRSNGDILAITCNWLIRELATHGLLKDVSLCGLVDGTPMPIDQLTALSSAHISGIEKIINELNKLVNPADPSGSEDSPFTLTGVDFSQAKVALLRLVNQLKSIESKKTVWVGGKTEPVRVGVDWNLAGWYLKV